MYVTDLNGNTEPLNHVQRVEITEEVNGPFTLALTSFFHANNPGHDLIEEETIITVEGYDFRVKQLKENNGRKEVVAPSTFFDLVHERQDDIYGGTRTFNEFASFVFSGTGWTFETDGSLGYALIPNFGEDNVIKLNNTLCDAFDCDFKIKPGNVVLFGKQIGGDNDFQFRYKHNIKALSKSVDTTNLRTAIKGIGFEGLEVVYIADSADKYGVRWADPIENDDIMTAEEFDPILKQELRSQQVDMSYELDNIELLDREIGESIWLIHEPMGIELQTHIMKKFSTYQNGTMQTVSVVVGNAIPRTLQDITMSQKVEIDENEKKTRSRFEQTNDRITMEVERIGDSIATLEIKADNIILSVEKLEDSVAAIDVKADNIILSVAEIGDRVEYNESQISIQADQIASKVSNTDFNGNTITSLINQTATTIDIQASKINLMGAVTVLSDISGKLGDITAGNIDIMEEIKVGAGIYLRGDGLYTGVYFGNTQIVQDTTGYLNLLNRVRIGNFVEINGQLDLTGSNITWGNNRPTATWG